MVEITVHAEEVVERRADSRGRISLGPERAGKTVTVAIVETVEVQPDN